MAHARGILKPTTDAHRGLNLMAMRRGASLPTSYQRILEEGFDAKTAFYPHVCARNVTRFRGWRGRLVLTP